MPKLFIILLFFLLNQQFSMGQDFSFKPQFSTILNADKGKELLNQCTRCIPQNITGFWNLTQSDVNTLENNFKKIKNLKSSKCGIEGSISELNIYLFQYIGITIGSKKLLYINAFASRDSKDIWKTEPVKACDGGIYYWGAIFDIETLEFSNLEFNEEG